MSDHKNIKRFGGYINYNKMLEGQKAMQLAAMQLPSVISYDDGSPIWFLTGKNYLYQTLFCIRSLSKFTTSKFKFILVDDGTFDAKLTEQVKRQLPGAVLIMKNEIDKKLDEFLPYERYPHLRKKREVYPHLRKLTDVHTSPGDSWKMVLDSDMLFWDKPETILVWLKKPDKPVHMLDFVESYGYSNDLMKEICGNAVPELLNVGIIGLNSANINWDELDRWLKLLEEKGGASYYLEQALTAMLIGDKSTVVLNVDTYKVNPSLEVKISPTLNHYVDLSKKQYFINDWRKLI